MNLREWLIVLGGVIIAGIVIDGIRRMRRARRDSLEISLGMGGEIENTPLDEGFNPELPNGGARLANSAIPSGENEAGTEESNNINDINYSTDQESRVEPSIALDGADDGVLSAARVVPREPKVSFDGKPTETNDSPDQGIIRATKPATSTRPESGGVAKPKGKMTFGEGLKASNSKAKPASSQQKQSKEDKKPKPAQEVIVLNVMSKSAEGFNGADLKTLLEACGVEHGDMSIFHRHENAVDSPVQFSVANAVEPGYFPKDELDSLATPGICFFMSLPGPEDNMRAFDYMVETAQCVVRNLSGEMKDERRSDMTPQTLEHCRQRIRDFERRQLATRC